MKISFVDLNEDHVEQVRLWRNLDHVAKYMINDQKITSEQQRSWFNKVKNDLTKKYFVILIDDNPVGLVNFINMDQSNKTADWGFYIGNIYYLSRGFGIKIMRMAIEYAFNDLGLRSVNAEIIANNSISIYLHKKLGFIERGVIKGKIEKNGKLHDIMIFRLDNHESY